jgi:hypothetical protein
MKHNKQLVSVFGFGSLDQPPKYSQRCKVVREEAYRWVASARNNYFNSAAAARPTPQMDRLLLLFS